MEWLLSRWRLAVPAATSLLCVFLLTMPLFPEVAVLPHMGLLAVLVWCTYRPTLMPAWLAFLLGAVTDAWLGLPLGINATLLPAVALVLQLLDQRFPERPFALEWALAAPLILVYRLVEWQLLSLFGEDLTLGALLPQAAVTFLAYPAAAYLFAGLNRRLLEVV